MDEVAFQDWPGPPVDLNTGNNPWMPAYGFQTPSALLEKEDFVGNPDAEYFLQNTTGQYMYLETIQEETSDDLRSDSDVDSRNSPVGWLATDSEDGSVICMDQLDDVECDSDREIACPPKRRKQDIFLTVPGTEDDEETSLSRSSSLLQFETLEKECQQESQSPSIFSQFSFDSLEVAKARKEFVAQDFSPEYDGDIFRSFGNPMNSSKQSVSRDSLLYNASTRYSSSDSSDSDTTVENSRSCDNLKTWRSFDSLLLGAGNTTKKFSSENLSEDSGYGDQLLTTLSNYTKSANAFLTNLSSSVGNLDAAIKKNDSDRMSKNSEEKRLKAKKNSYVGFGAYDCDVFQNFHGNFGVSYQDLSIFDRFDPFGEPLSKSSPLTDVFLRKKHVRQLLNANAAAGQTHAAINLNINLEPENSFSNSAKFSRGNVSHAASVPNLLLSTERASSVDIHDLNVYSVPKDLNFIGEFSGHATASVAEKNWNLADLNFNLSGKSESLNDLSAFGANSEKTLDDNLVKNISIEDNKRLETTQQEAEDDFLNSISDPEETMSNYKREGSYSEAMTNRVDLSDDENSLVYKKKLPKSPIVDFDRRVLKAISEQSLQSIRSTTSLHGSQKFLDQPISYLEKPVYTTSTPTKKYQNKSTAVSTPDLNRIEPVVKREKNPYFDEDRRKSTQEMNAARFDTTRLEEERNKNILLDGSADECEVEFRRKGSTIKSSTSTSGMSDIDEKTLKHSVKSFTGSNGSKDYDPRTSNFITVASAEKKNRKNSNLSDRSECSDNSGVIKKPAKVFAKKPHDSEGGRINHKREGSYTEAMTNRVDLSDDENSLLYKKKLPKSTIVDFDRKVLKAISEQSLRSLLSSTNSLHGSQILLDEPVFTTTPTKSVTKSTPNLNRIEPVVKRGATLYLDEDRRKSTQEISASKFEQEIDVNVKLKTKESVNENILRDSVSSSCSDSNGIQDNNNQPRTSLTTASLEEKTCNLTHQHSDISDQSENSDWYKCFGANYADTSDPTEKELGDMMRDLSFEEYNAVKQLEEILGDDSELDTTENEMNLRNVREQSVKNYRREGSYSEAMSNRVDLSDDENSLVYKKKLPKSPIVEFDRTALKAISEQSLRSLASSTSSLHGSQPKEQSTKENKNMYRNKSFTKSTPNLNRAKSAIKRERNPYFDDERRKSTLEISPSRFDTTKLEEERRYETEFRRTGSILKSSTSTSGVSDIDEKTLRGSVRRFSGSNGKGVHFSPVVAEVNWKDDASTSTVTPDRESLYSLNSSSPEPMRSSPKGKLVKPKPQYPNPQAARRSVSHPDLSDSESKIYKREFIDSLHNLRNQDMSKSQPDVSRLKRRGSQLIKRDRDGCTIQAYVDLDGVQYKHTHLDVNSVSRTSLAGSNQALHAKPNTSVGGAQNSGSKNNLTSKFPLYHPHGEENMIRQPSRGKQLNSGAMADQADVTTGGAGGGDARSKRKNKSGLGGFLQRLASFRLGAKKGQDQKDKLKRKAQGNGAAATVQPTSQRTSTNASNQSSNQKPNYIYIPLKEPAPLDNNNTKADPVPAGKPPLPKQPPPRVVHASVKKTHASNGVGLDERRRRRTIDSASGAVEARDVGRHGHGNDSMDGPMGLIETDLDTEVTVITNGANAKARSLLDLGPEPRLQVPQNADGSQSSSSRPHKSMEFLLDKQNLKVVEPPENELQKTERVMSEHELRVQRSLQKLTVPEWYKNSQVPTQGFLLKKSRETRWTGTGSKTTSLSSLGSGTQSPLVLSPTPTSQPFVRWSTSKLNSTASSPCQSTRSSFNQGRQPNGSISPSSARSSFNYRQPYMGWRSQERLNRPRTPAERLASSLLSKQNLQTATLQHESPEIQTSIKEVTSAIVHYVSGLKPSTDGIDNQDNSSQRSSSVSPRGSQKLCWLESSFVGTKPLDSPETPVTCSESPVPPQSLRLDLQNHSSNDLAMLSTSDTRVRPSPSSTTLEDVLDSLLGLPPSGRAASPCLQETVSASTSPQRRSSDADANGAYRRRSEGSEPATGKVDPALPTPILLRCRYSRCGKTALPMSKDAKSFKNCHNCSYTYCSRACRRSHWERHRKTCLFSRMGTLCRQVIQAVRDQKDTLKELSKVARRGYISHGLGAVKCFYPNPEAAEKFLAEGLQSLGELTFVRWQDLLPTEMGPLLYKELVEMCQNYNSETKFVLYISLCVVSETPASGAVKWERQLVSRCAKLRLSKDLNFIAPERDTEPPETLILTCPPIRLPTPETSMRARLIACNNLQSQLRERGVSLKRQYPDIYKRLDAYCEDLSVKFEAQTIYPRNATTNKSFMCIIMLESEPETLKHVEKAGVRVRTVDCLLSCETTTTL